MGRTIEIAPYDPAWADAFQAEAGSLSAVFGRDLAEIEHIGSTAVPGMMAKAVIDILIVVEDLERVPQRIEAMQVLGYEHRGEAGIPGRQFFRKDTGGIRSHHVHIFPEGHPSIAAHINFRDYLRAHPEHAQAYAQLKLELAARFRTSPTEYTEAKTDFIEQINRLAAVWRAGQSSD